MSTSSPPPDAAPPDAAPPDAAPPDAAPLDADAPSDAPPPDVVPLPVPLTWHALVRDANATYSTLELGACTSLNAFCQYLNHLPAPSVALRTRCEWRLGARAKKTLGYGLCVFDSAVGPKWEDAGNTDGVDLVFRGALGPQHLDDAWLELLLVMLSGETVALATGARVLVKSDRRGNAVHKLEVWTRAAGPATTAPLLRDLKRRTGLDFTVVPRRLDGK